MCGILGTIQPEANLVFHEAVRFQAHRGPDDDGTVELRRRDGSAVQLGSNRLAILDLSPAGHMPMATSDGRLTIVYNGEIYNYPKLRRELEGKGYVFRSGSDTEAILYLYQEHGPDCVKRLNGMFAIAIWDRDGDALFLARDHFGIKPLYYTQQGEQFAFASELKALLQLPGVDRQINLAALQQYLALLWVPEPHTMFAAIQRLPAGHYGVLRDGDLRLTQYWDLTYPEAEYAFPHAEAALVAELRERLQATVAAQMLSDVPVGAFLSAGLDSSSIVASMARVSSQPVRTFTITFPERHRRGENTIDNPDVARRTAEHFGCDHTEIVVEPHVADLLPKLTWHMDDPTADPAIIMAYLVNREARQHATVLLSGVGGDELFGGYRKYRADRLAGYYQHLPAPIRGSLVEPLIDALPSLRGTPLKGHMRLAKKLARTASLPREERFLASSVYLDAAQRHELLTDGARAAIGNSDPLAEHLARFDRVREADFLNQMLYLDLKTFMVSLNLNYNDKMSMASSVEVRVPFLDWELAEWVAWNVPPQLKLRGGTGKYVLREAMRPLLPPEVLTQSKAGFGAPIDHWLATDLRSMVDDLLSPAALHRRGLFESQAVGRLIDEHRSGRRDWAMQIWQLLTLELWFQTFVDTPITEASRLDEASHSVV